MKNAKQPINPMTFTRCGEGEDDFRPLKEGERTGFEKTFTGLTKREYFAGLAMQGLLANSAFKIDTDTDVKVTAQYTISAIKYADELLKQLEK